MYARNTAQPMGSKSVHRACAVFNHSNVRWYNEPFVSSETKQVVLCCNSCMRVLTHDCSSKSYYPHARNQPKRTNWWQLLYAILPMIHRCRYSKRKYSSYTLSTLKLRYSLPVCFQITVPLSLACRKTARKQSAKLRLLQSGMQTTDLRFTADEELWL